MYIYRVLNDNDIKNIKNGLGIIAKKPIDINSTFFEGLKMINTHIKNGCTINTCWISASKDFKTVAKQFCLPQNGFASKRPPMAIIDNHEGNIVLDKINKNLFSFNDAVIMHNIDAIRNFKMADIKQCNFDLSDRKICKQLGALGLIVKKDGSPVNNNVLAYSYSTNSKELITLNQINMSDIVNVLNPFQIDLVYCLSKFISAEEAIERIKKIHSANLDSLESTIYNELYNNCKHIYQIVEEIINQYPDRDVLSVYKAIKDVKRSIIGKFTNFPVHNVEILEDRADIIRIGNYTKNNFNNVSYNNENIIINPLQKNIKTGKYYSTDLINSIYIYDSSVDINDKNAYWLSDDQIVNKEFYKNFEGYNQTEGIVKDKDKIKIIRPLI